MILQGKTDVSRFLQDRTQSLARAWRLSLPGKPRPVRKLWMMPAAVEVALVMVVAWDETVAAAAVPRA